MNRTQREASKQHYEKLRQARAAQKALSAKEQAKKEKAIADALAKAALAKQGKRCSLIFGGPELVFSKAPKLSDGPYRTAVTRLLELPAIRPLAEWEPKGKGRDTLFRSLAEHLLAKYPTPGMLWSGFFDGDGNAVKLAPLIAHAAAGGSLFDYAKKDDFPIPLTRGMCHELLQTTGVTLMQALRRTQVKAAGGSLRLYQAIMSTREGRLLGTRQDEAFWMTVMAWFAKNPMLDLAQIGPLVDYIGHRHRQDNAFSMKARSALAMIRGMNEWHGDLAKEKSVKGTVFKPSGYKPLEIDQTKTDRNGQRLLEIWRVFEIQSSKELAAEGRRMSHCVLSYAYSIESGRTAIWSMTKENNDGNWAMLTVEVRNDLKRIVQARGKYNRQATNEEFRVLTKWANSNNLGISLGGW